ncbi:phosphonates import ATP-binding protein PhnC 2 [Tistrella bauzanensis]|uniref:Phosphonates import ATP-binding protein PhnC 2 n=1 Tax=Tistrella bauzanensis TaxID=657419 RepID=A0ABQ1I9G9_9PROT|nr:phosphonate ABC transporter ATP-binding protein [Tistrella bauzanensis]GGB24608.1 phosphonates import ATP-binding protein PhnC 2 [Tistrella bauzanensis]
MTDAASGPAIKVARLTKTFRGHRALDAVSFEIGRGEMVALIGASGSGKSTLMRHLSGLIACDRNDGGAIRVLGGSVQQNGRIARDIRSRRARIGVVFQQFNLVGRLSVITNVLTGTLGTLPLWRVITGRFRRVDQLRALAALDRVGIAEWAHRRASTLSGGQQQRAAIARALVQQAEVIMADEPIASLDPESAKRVMDTLARINAEDGTTVVVSLHQVDYALKYCPRVIALAKGRLIYDGPSAALTTDLLASLYGTEVEDIGLPDRPAAPQPLGAEPAALRALAAS